MIPVFLIVIILLATSILIWAMTMNNVVVLSPSSTALVSFPSRRHVARIVQGSPYFERFTPLDCRARGVATPEQYKKKYVDAALGELSLETRAALSKCAQRAAEACRAEPAIADLGRAPWRIVLFDPSVENGYPHTLGDAIFLPSTFVGWSEDDQVSTMIHERVHVLQRMHPEAAQAWIRANGYARVPDEVARRALSRVPVRANPDVDGHLYADSSTGCAVAQVYASAEPASLADSRVAHVLCSSTKGVPTQPPVYEHPYEHMAYAIEKARGPPNRSAKI